MTMAARAEARDKVGAVWCSAHAPWSFGGIVDLLFANALIVNDVSSRNKKSSELTARKPSHGPAKVIAQAEVQNSERGKVARYANMQPQNFRCLAVAACSQLLPNLFAFACRKIDPLCAFWHFRICWETAANTENRSEKVACPPAPSTKS